MLTLSCGHGAAADAAPGRVVLPCVAMAPPALVDFIISRDLADGVCIAGCSGRDCYNRAGMKWTEQRFARQRDPYLRARVPRERVLTVWAGPTETRRLTTELADFSERLAAMPTYEKVRPLADEEAAREIGLAAGRSAAK